MSLITGSENKIFALSDQGLVRTAQEDSYGFRSGEQRTPNGDVFVVCDGMGGHVGGREASNRAVESIFAYLMRGPYPSPIDALNGALRYANDQIFTYAKEHPELKGMGTTACILLLQGDEAWIAHVGDSRIYLFLAKERELHRITKDHSFVQALVDAGQITDEEAEHHPNKNRILKALGILPNVEPSFNEEPIHPLNDDVFLICSDGLSGMIPDSTIERVLSKTDVPLDKKGEELIHLAMEGETVRPGGQDNCTLELIQIDNSPWQERQFHSYRPVFNPHITDQPSHQLDEVESERCYMAAGDSDMAERKSGSKKRLLFVLIPAIAVFTPMILTIVVWLALNLGGNSPIRSKAEWKNDSIAVLESINALQNAINDCINDTIEANNKYKEGKIPKDTKERRNASKKTIINLNKIELEKKTEELNIINTALPLFDSIEKYKQFINDENTTRQDVRKYRGKIKATEDKVRDSEKKLKKSSNDKKSK